MWARFQRWLRRRRLRSVWARHIRPLADRIEQAAPVAEDAKVSVRLSALGAGSLPDLTEARSLRFRLVDEGLREVGAYAAIAGLLRDARRAGGSPLDMAYMLRDGGAVDALTERLGCRLSDVLGLFARDRALDADLAERVAAFYGWRYEGAERPDFDGAAVLSDPDWEAHLSDLRHIESRMQEIEHRIRSFRAELRDGTERRRADDGRRVERTASLGAAGVACLDEARRRRVVELCVRLRDREPYDLSGRYIAQMIAYGLEPEEAVDRLEADGGLSAVLASLECTFEDLMAALVYDDVVLGDHADPLVRAYRRRHGPGSGSVVQMPDRDRSQ